MEEHTRGPNRPRRGLVVGLTGGIATGKSTAARMFAELGAAVVSADEAARDVVRPGEPALDAIREAFGDGVVRADGTLDRKALGTLVFQDVAARRRLEAITHPHIRRLMRRRITEAAAGGRTVVAEIPLLFESEGALDLVDATVVVVTEETVQRARLMARDDVTEEEAKQRMAAQMPLEEKVAQADWVIDNNGTERELRARVQAVWRSLHEEQEMTK